jgi:hypothetical protein
MENHIPDLIRHYLKGLEERDEAAILSLFAVEGIVLSPLYGRRRAKDFYPGLFADTGRSVISLHHILRDTYRPDVAAAYFRYDWNPA